MQTEETSSPPRSLGELLARATPRVFVTQVLVVLNVLVYAAMVVSGVDPINPTIPELIEWGANFGPAVMLQGEWWRMLSSVFVHIGALHLAVNMWALWNLGQFCERLYGNLTFALVYLVAGVGGALGSIAWNPVVVSAGASGAVFGICGAVLAFLLFRPGALPPEIVRGLRSRMVVIIGINLAFGFSVGFVDNAAHVGGLLTGALAGALTTRDLWQPGSSSILRPARALLVLLVLAAQSFITRGKVEKLPQVVERQQASEAYAHLQRVISLLDQGNLEEARVNAERAVELAPDMPETLRIRGWVLSMQGEWERAEQDYDRVLQLQPKDTLTLSARARVRDALGRHDEAVDDLTAALALEPESAAFYGERALARMRQGAYDAALADHDEALRREPEDATFHNNKAWTLLHAGRPREALASAERAVALEPESAYVLGTRCWARAALGETQGAIEDCRKSVEKASAHRLDEGMLKMLSGQPAEALAIWEEELEKEPDERPLVEPWMEEARRSLEAGR